MKKLLFLGGSFSQVPAIKRAKELGYYVITVDYLPNNPGHVYSDEYFNVSTTDKEAILNLAKDLGIEGIIAYASDPGAPVAAYVAEKLELPTSPLESIEILGEKHLWRKFLLDNGFDVPNSQSGKEVSNFNFYDWNFPLMVKPVDSSGSKGVTKIFKESEFKNAFIYAQEFSRNKIVIVEEFIEKVGCQIGGDGFYGKDRLDFVCFGDQYVDQNTNPFVPAGMMFPSSIEEFLKRKIFKEIERALSLLRVQNLSFNLEVMLDKQGRVYLMEIGPRNGGNFIPQVIESLTGVSLVDLALKSAVGEIDKVSVFETISQCCFGYYAVHSNKVGKLNNIKYLLPSTISIIDSSMFKKTGDLVEKFNGSNCTIGILVLKFLNKEVMIDFYNNVDKYIQVFYE
ncbi:hypothetical protein HMPREF9714_02155 [Myroides odoratimimus CCUG 12901]|uniref:ATP-grasp domain-containing protein n=1 Tax=Myroides odoratimimus CCUG 10230 TaxID=883150 RepID=A0ABP2NC21_9FLAO|nr:ATP-grasp domain-containing protein [Myroides odoratimimus]EHO08784.1 hypothetical protein HMPREF9714_02155 [Myroides odoratimimus CCUG 12901]EHO10190.1 hypothetical protein HMPREF9712_01295 [Myroides odoratimimus CCUG 10230]